MRRVRTSSIFGGVVPASRPKLAAIVVIDEPRRQDVLRRRGRGAGVRQRHGRRAAVAGRAAGWPRSVAQRDARAGETRAMNVAAARRTAMQSRTEARTQENLRRLLAGITAVVPADVDDRPISRWTVAASAGRAFVALPGTRTHGVGFAAQAVDAGAHALSCGSPSRALPRRCCRAGCAVIGVPNLTAQLGSDRRPILRRTVDVRCRIVGVTGTNGKTTTASRHRGRAATTRRSVGIRGHDGLRTRRARWSRDAHDAGLHHRASAARELRDDGVRLPGHGGLLACARSASRRRRALRDRRVHQSHARSSGLSRHARSVRCGQGASCSRGRSLQHAVINADDAFGRDAARVDDSCRPMCSSLSRYGRSRNLPWSATPCVLAHVARESAWPRNRHRRQLGSGHAALAVHRRRSTSTICSAALAVLLELGRAACRARSRRSSNARAAGTHGNAHRSRQAARHRRLRTHAGCAGEGAACSAQRIARASSSACSAAAAIAIAASVR